MAILDSVFKDLKDITDEISAPFSAADEEEAELTLSPENTIEEYTSLPERKLKIPSGWDKGIMYNGEESIDAAFKLTNEEDRFKLLQTYSGATLSIDGNSSHNKDTNQRGAAFGIHFKFDCPIASEFTKAAKATYEDGNQVVMSTKDKTESTLLTLVCGEINLNPDNIKPTVSFLMAIDKALKHRDKEDQFVALQEVFQRYGYYYPTTIKFGKSHCRIPNYSADILNRSLDKVLEFAEQNVKNLRVIGGDDTELLHSVSKWTQSVENNQKVVFRTNMSPIYDLLDFVRKRKILDIYKPDENHDHIRYGNLYSMLHVNYGRCMYVDDERCIRSSSDAEDDRTYRDKVLFVYEKGEDWGNPLKIQLKYIPHASQPRAMYVKYGHEVLLESERFENEFIQVTNTPLARPRFWRKLFCGTQEKLGCTVVSLSALVKTNDMLKYRWQVTATAKPSQFEF
ncbi:hypothetical protein DFQ28_009083 [Apophysomyces sp. BC1034]|nr:hypothetical protein DFQ30_009061 [Apophysomyces sp. BC1015]KAG0192472.1 hypothetical protein DFQ28_009083 [Apophysomyces sp. BC1034]